MIATIVCAIGWLKNRISTLAIIYYITKKGYKMPTYSDLAECSQWVVKKMFKLKDQTRI